MTAVSTCTNTGGRFNTNTLQWVTTTSLTNAPIARRFHHGNYYNDSLVVWGGETCVGSALNDGGILTTGGGGWNTLSPTGAPTARRLAAHAVIGNELIIWGGANGTTPQDNGARIDLSTNTSWNLLSASPLAARYDTAFAVADNKLVIWGGRGGAGTFFNNGAIYDPSTNLWTPMTAAPGFLTQRYMAKMVSVGTKLVIFGGFDSTDLRLNTGAIYDLTNNSWHELPNTSGPGLVEARVRHAMISTGSEVLVFGGESDTFALDNLLRLKLEP